MAKEEESNGGSQRKPGTYELQKQKSMALLQQGGNTLAKRLSIAAGVRYKESLDMDQVSKLFRKSKAHEFWIYIVFLTVFSASSLQQRPVEETYDLIHQVYDGTVTGSSYISTTYFKNIGGQWRADGKDADIGSIDDFWAWMTEVPPQFLFQYNWYNGSSFEPDFQGVKWRVLQNNLIVQPPRLRQIRIEPKKCEVPRRMSSQEYGGVISQGSYNGTNLYMTDGISTCYPRMPSATISKETIQGLKIDNGTISVVPLPYKSAKELNSKSFTSRGSTTPITYEGGGYVQDFPLNISNDEFKSMLAALKAMRWTDRQTRAVVFDWVIYNQELNTFLSVRLVFEFQPHGFVVGYQSLRAMRMGYVRANDVFLLIMDAVVYGIVFFSIFNSCYKVYLLSWDFFGYFWNVVDLMNYLFFLVSLYYKVIFFLETQTFVSTPVSSAVEYVDFDYVGSIYNLIASWNGFNALFTWMKIFSFLKFLSSAAEQLIETIAKAGANLSIFAGLLFVVLWAYAQTMYVSFGAYISDYKALYSACVNTFKALLGGFDIDQLNASNAYLGPLIYITFLFVAFFVMLNMFLAIIAKTYDDVSNQETVDPMAFEFREGILFSLRVPLRLLGFSSILDRHFRKDKDQVSGFSSLKQDDDRQSSVIASSLIAGGKTKSQGSLSSDPPAQKLNGKSPSEVIFKDVSKDENPPLQSLGSNRRANYNNDGASAAVDSKGRQATKVTMLVPDEVLLGLLSSVRDLSNNVRELGGRLDDLSKFGAEAARQLENELEETRRGHALREEEEEEEPRERAPRNYHSHSLPLAHREPYHPLQQSPIRAEMSWNPPDHFRTSKWPEDDRRSLRSPMVDWSGMSPTSRMLAATADMISAVAVQRDTSLRGDARMATPDLGTRSYTRRKPAKGGWENSPVEQEGVKKLRFHAAHEEEEEDDSTPRLPAYVK
ncbi:hypothetical protein GUITHDRAFT_114246 [Guillardia theta CCMP2712]|uniref:Uncharacterized protein n=1 Tax=Guillardia theta (strain CCMP2712) TaxID=905079 RepID=L1IV88_GUITC|nr:hypothetical protein GUITHDRAFT_114246 [Guillardia theta CCMP2712]EKX39750.1 hypothetical protein GUITHDRAFT_114246 [Guillardia theta CCMP2712]|eukprot:XP_005826730.1 hypothetical protein GUITHDRAFT_114246 [Guillardia theta CCMP2712]